MNTNKHESGRRPDYHTLVAQALRENPDLLKEGSRTLTAWEGHGYIPLTKATLWREILSDAQTSTAGFQRLLEILESPQEEARAVRDFSPFAGILPANLRQRQQLCSFAHSNI